MNYAINDDSLVKFAWSAASLSVVFRVGRDLFSFLLVSVLRDDNTTCSLSQPPFCTCHLISFLHGFLSSRRDRCA